jgi:Transposase DDE domain
MLRANLKIISSLKDFLILVSNKSEYRNLFCFSKGDFTRKRKLPFQVLALFIVKLCKKTLSVELEKHFLELRSGLSCSVAAFSLQRMKLNPAFFDAWNKVLWMSFYEVYKNKVKRWRGFRILGCDGSSISLVNRPVLKNYFGGQNNQASSYVIAKTFYCYDVLNQLILFPFIAPYRYGEHKMACDFIESGMIEQDMLLIFDRFYSSYIIAALLQYKEKEIKFVIRVNENYNFSKRFIESKKKSEVIEIFPSISSIKNLKLRGYIVKADTPLKVRLVRVSLADNKTEILMTNLWEEDGYANDEFKTLYALRWGVESNIDFPKKHLAIRIY